jgi:predicted TIM-barrel fold metal-dependent hydrolase
LIALLDAGGIRKAAVLSLGYQYGNPNRPPVEHEYEAVKAENDWTSAQVAKYPDRLVAFCSVNPLKDYALDEIVRCGKDPRLRAGLKLHFGNSDVNVSDPAHAPRLREVFALANRQRMAIVVHARTTISKQRPYGAAHARAFLTLLEAAPDVPVQIAHLAGSGGYDEAGVDDAVGVFVDAIAAKDPRVARLWFDVSGIALIGKWPAPAGRVAERIRQIGIDRVVWGADGAAGGTTPEAAWKAFSETPLTPAEVETIRTNVAPYLR